MDYTLHVCEMFTLLILALPIPSHYYLCSPSNLPVLVLNVIEP